MSNQLQTNLETILNEKNTNLLPENLKAGVTCLGVNGTYEGTGGSNGIKLFETQEAMQADATAEEGDLAVVYRSEVQNATVDSKFQTATFPDTVVLDNAITDSVEVRYRAVDSSVMFDCWGSLDSSMFRMDCYTETGSIRIQYTSEDGITYTRTDSTGNPVDFGTEIYYEYTDMWNDAIGKFIQVGGSTFGGLFVGESIIKQIQPIKMSTMTINAETGVPNISDVITLNYNVNNFAEKIYPMVKYIDTLEGMNSHSRYPYCIYLKDNNTISIIADGNKSSSVMLACPVFVDNTFKGLIAAASGVTNFYEWQFDLATGGYIGKNDVVATNYTTFGSSTNKYYYTTAFNDYYYIGNMDWTGSDFTYVYSLFYNNTSYSADKLAMTGVIGVVYFSAPTQLTLDNPNELLPGQIAYGLSGVVTGDDSIYDNIGIAKPLSTVTGIDIDTKDILLEPMKDSAMPKGNNLVLIDGDTNYLYCRRLLPEVDITGMNKVVINSNRLLGVIQDSATNTITFKSYNLNTGETKIENTYTFTSISNITVKINQATDELGYIVLADRTSSKFIVYKLENDIATEVINMTLTCEGMYTSGVDLDLLFGSDNHLYIGIVRPTKTVYIYKLVDTSLVEVTHTALHSSFDYHNDIYCLRTGDHLYFGYFRTWSFTSDMSHKIIHINTTTGNVNIITSTYKEKRMDDAKLHYDNENMYIVNSVITIKVSPTSVTASNLLIYSSVNADYYYYDSTTNISTVQYGPYKGSWINHTTGVHKESSFGFSLSNPSENSDSISIVDRTFLNNPNDACFYMRHKNIIAKGFVCYWLNNKSFIEDLNDISPYIRISDTAMIKLGHTNPKVMNYEGTISPEEYTEAVETANKILNEEV